MELKVKSILGVAALGVLASCSSLDPAASFQNAISAVSDSALPSVVHIDVSGTTLEQVPRMGPFGLFSGAPRGISKVPMRALGSGILISTDGLIVTNNHVVENADSIRVHFYDGTEQPARLIGSDRFTDIAVLKVEGTGSARVARMGNSDALRVGEWVVAIGSPRGLDWTVTAGIVSATHRMSVDTNAPIGLEDFIQTDTAINPGNSGGPLLNLRGEVIGMNALIMSESQGSEGLGFAIPSNTLKVVTDTLIRHGKMTRGDLGIQTQDLNASLRKGLKLPSEARGVLVTEAVPLGPGAAAALRAGDLITSFEQTPIVSAIQLNKLIAGSAPGASVSLRVARDNAQLTVILTVADQLELSQRQAARPAYALLGVRVDPVSDSLAKDIGLTDAAGVVVVEVVTGSPADNVGIAKGDIIFEVDGEDVNTRDQFRQHVGDAIQTGNVVVLLRDGASGRTGFMEIPLR